MRSTHDMTKSLGRRLLAVSVGITLCALAPSSLAQSTQKPGEFSAAGTWEIRVCKAIRACLEHEHLSILARGILVLSEDSLGMGDLPASARPWFALFAAPGRARSCYTLERLRHPGSSTTYAGIFPVRWSGWTRGEALDSIAFSLYRSPDAGHVVYARILGDSLHGSGKSHMAPAMGDLTSWGTDIVIGKRIGPANPAPCIAAAKRLNWPNKPRSR